MKPKAVYLKIYIFENAILFILLLILFTLYY